MGLRGEHGGGGVGGESLIVSALPIVLNIGGLGSEEAHKPFFNRMMQDGLIARPGMPILKKSVNDYRGIQFASWIVSGVTQAVTAIGINAKCGKIALR